jgi:hypothetical protein
MMIALHAKGIFVRDPVASPWTHPVVIAAAIAVILCFVAGLTAILRWMPAAPAPCASCGTFAAASAVQSPPAPYHVAAHTPHPRADVAPQSPVLGLPSPHP